MLWIWGALQVRFEAQPWLDHVRQGWALPQVTKNPPLIYVGYQAKGAGAEHQSTAYLSAETLYICIVWICEALQVRFEAQP